MARKPAYLRRTCQYCGHKSEAQRREDGPRAWFTDAAGRQSWRVSTAVEYMPAFIVNDIHERTCASRAEF